MDDTIVQTQDTSLSKNPMQNLKREKKEWIAKGLSLLCIIVALLLTFNATWWKIDGIKRKNLREMKDAISQAELGDISETQLDELIDSGFVNSRKDFLKWTKNLKKNLNTALSTKYSLAETSEMYTFSVDLVSRGEKLYESSENAFRYLQLPPDLEEEIGGAIGIMKAANIAQILLLATIGLLGLATAVFLFIPKAKAIKYIYFAMTLFLTLSIIAGVIAVNVNMGSAWDEMQLPMDTLKALGDIKVNITAAPIFAAIFSFAPCILEKIMLRKKGEE